MAPEKHNLDGSVFKVSVHGGHSGQYCCHARDSLDQVVAAYQKAGFAWVVISEHAPARADVYAYPDEIEAGFDARSLLVRFKNFCDHCRSLQRRSAAMKILVAMETETCGDYIAWIDELRNRFSPDLLVGAVHHVDDIPFDYSPDQYRRALEAYGSLEKLYCRYFDLQYEMLQAIRPQVVAHFDLIRIFDSDYGTTLSAPSVVKKIERNLELVADLGLVLDCNVSAYRKGFAEPYPARHILLLAAEMGIAAAPGDDSHGVETVGVGIQQGVALLEAAGFNGCWRSPPPLVKAMEDAGLGPLRCDLQGKDKR